MARRPSSVRPSVCKLLRKSLLLAGKWPDRHQTFTRWTPGQRASRMCSRTRSRSKVTWYAHFLGFLEWATPSLTVWFTFSLLWPSWPWFVAVMVQALPGHGTFGWYRRWMQFEWFVAPKLKGRKRRKKLGGYSLNDTATSQATAIEQTETRAKSISTLIQVQSSRCLLSLRFLLCLL